MNELQLYMITVNYPKRVEIRFLSCYDNKKMKRVMKKFSNELLSDNFESIDIKSTFFGYLDSNGIEYLIPKENFVSL